MMPIQRLEDDGETDVRIGTGDDPPVTVCIMRRPQPGHEAAFEHFLEGITEAASRFPGHLGASIVRPEGDEREYRVVLTFDHISNLRKWDDSEERRAWYARARELAEDEPELSVLTGLETWFTLSASGAVVPPPRYKMWLLSWLAIWPLITLLSFLGQPVLEEMPIPLRTLTLTGILLPTMTWIVMPRMTRLFRRWLYPER